MHRTEWFHRTFPPIADNGLFPGILERLEGTPARLYSKIAKLNAPLSSAPAGQWSIHKEIGHLIDLEPLWLERALQVLEGQAHLKSADLSNQKTHQADHDAVPLGDLLAQFETERQQLLAVLRQATAPDLTQSAVHPRLGTPMKLIDLAFFVAEHDDHHLAQITVLSAAT
ncbi:MAG: DinB family protein [Saprospiraceae bacterium]|nr:DinB family protein [Saprospiraceae bacterium]